jgi:hypothetical protein
MGCTASDARHPQMLSPIKLQLPVATGQSQASLQENLPKIKNSPPHLASQDSNGNTADSEPRAKVITKILESSVVSRKFILEQSFSDGGRLGQSHYLSENSLMNNQEEACSSDDQEEVPIYVEDCPILTRKYAEDSIQVSCSSRKSLKSIKSLKSLNYPNSAKASWGKKFLIKTKANFRKKTKRVACPSSRDFTSDASKNSILAPKNIGNSPSNLSLSPRDGLFGTKGPTKAMLETITGGSQPIILKIRANPNDCYPYKLQESLPVVP